MPPGSPTRIACAQAGAEEEAVQIVMDLGTYTDEADTLLSAVARLKRIRCERMSPDESHPLVQSDPPRSPGDPGLGSVTALVAVPDPKGPAMTDLKLTDPQLMLLSRAAQRDDLLVSLPETLKGGAARAVVSKLLSQSLVEEIAVGPNNPSWRKDEHEQLLGLKLTRAGLGAIGLEPEDGTSHAGQPSGATDAAGQAAADRAAVRDGSKRALVVALLCRAEGAGLDDLVQATGWLPPTTRAALTGLRQRGYVLIRDTGEGGRSVYRITSPPDQATTAQPAPAEA
jgi:hypothetical protein